MAKAQFDEASLSGLLAHEIDAATRDETDDASVTRARNIEYLRGEMNDIPARPNGSSATSRDINDTMAWMLPSLVRVFTASDRFAIFEPTEPGDEKYAEQATDYANFVFFKDNDGYRVIYDAAYDALGVSGDGIVKHWWDDTPVTEITYHTGLTIEQVTLLDQEKDVEILAQDKGETQIIQFLDDQGQEVQQEIETFDLKIERTKRNGCLRVECIEPENFLINEEAIDIPDFRFCAHRDPYKTRSDLIEMGFDAEIVDRLGAESTHNSTEEGFARQQDWNATAQPIRREMDRIHLFECYIKVDVDGDGIAETLQVFYAGYGGSGEVLDWEVWEDEVPFTKISCYPRAHQFTSESVADRTRDVQQIKTILLRQGLDNLYASNLPMQEIEQNSVVNPDILVNPKFGGVIWKKKGSLPIQRHEVPFVADKAFTGMEFMDGIVEKRTGVSRSMMALDPEALQNQTATASQAARDASYSQTELVARNMAEGWRKAFMAILKLLVKHQDRPRVIRLRDDFVEMDPRVWNANMDCSINVGLGSGSRDRDMAMLNVILNAQREMMAGFLQTGFKDRALMMLPKITKTLHALTESAGIKNPETFFPEIDDDDLKEMAQKAQEMANQPDPQIELEKAKMQMQAELEQNKLQAQAQAEEMKAQGNAVKERAQMEADLIVKQAERENELQIKAADREWEREKFQKEMEFKYAELATKRQEAKEKAEREEKVRNMDKGEGETA